MFSMMQRLCFFLPKDFGRLLMAVTRLCSTALCFCICRQRVAELGVWTIYGEKAGRVKKNKHIYQLISWFSVIWIVFSNFY